MHVQRTKCESARRQSVRTTLKEFENASAFSKVPARCRVKVALRRTYVSCACAMPHPL